MDDRNDHAFEDGDAAAAVSTSSTTVPTDANNETVHSPDDSGAAARSPPVSFVPDTAVSSGTSDHPSAAPNVTATTVTTAGSSVPSILKREQQHQPEPTIVPQGARPLSVPSSTILARSSTASNPIIKTEPTEAHDRNTNTNTVVSVISTTESNTNTSLATSNTASNPIIKNEPSEDRNWNTNTNTAFDTSNRICNPIIKTEPSEDRNQDSDSDSEADFLTTPNLVDHEVSKKYKSSVNSNLTDNTINGEEFHSANTDRLEKLLKDLTKEVKKIKGAMKAYGRHSTDNVTEDGGTRVTAETTPPSVSKTLKNTRTSITNDLRAYVRDDYYLDMKFAGSDAEQEALLLDAIKSGRLQVPDGVTKRQFRNFFVPQVPSSFSRLRGNSQTLCQKHWRADILKGLVPKSFPGSLELVEDPNNEGEVIINPEYRKYSTANNGEFFYFVSRMLPSINPKKVNFSKECSNKSISEIFSVSDEAFALLLLYNEHHVWVDNMRTGEESVDSEDEGTSKTRKKKKRKRFCDPSSGRKQGWEWRGKKLYNTLCKKVQQLREDKSTGEALEKMMMERFQLENGGHLDTNGKITATNDNQEEEEYRTEAHRKALVRVTESDWDE